MFSFYFIKNKVPDGVIRIPSAIRDSVVINGKDEPGVFIPQSIYGDIFRENCLENNTPLGIEFSNGLLCAVDRFHDPAAIYREVSHAAYTAGYSPPASLEGAQLEVGKGVDPVDATGFHDLASSYLVVDRVDHFQWFSFIRIDRTVLPYVASSHSDYGLSGGKKKLIFNINRIHCFIKPSHASFENIFLLTGSMIGSLIGSELEKIAFDLKKTHQTIELNIGLDAIKGDDALLLFSGVTDEIRRSISSINEEPDFFSTVIPRFVV